MREYAEEGKIDAEVLPVLSSRLGQRDRISGSRTAPSPRTTKAQKNTNCPHALTQQHQIRASAITWKTGLSNAPTTRPTLKHRPWRVPARNQQLQWSFRALSRSSTKRSTTPNSPVSTAAGNSSREWSSCRMCWDAEPTRVCVWGGRRRTVGNSQ